MNEDKTVLELWLLFLTRYMDSTIYNRKSNKSKERRDKERK
jgi:hypothetical protein